MGISSTDPGSTTVAESLPGGKELDAHWGWGHGGDDSCDSSSFIAAPQSREGLCVSLNRMLL